MPVVDLAEELRQLEAFVAQVRHETNSDAAKQDHRDIYSFIEEKVLSPKAELINEVPPLWLVIYAIENILHPTLVKEQIPDLLDLLATAEFYRGRTLDKARDAVVWSKYYEREGREEGQPLSASQRKELLSLEDKKHLWRRVYFSLIKKYSYVDLYFLWTAKPPSMTDFFLRFNEYFPFLTDTCPGSPRLFYKGLSGKECLELGEIGLECCDFAQDTVDWAMEQQQHDWPQSISEKFQTKEFQAAFPLLCDLESINKDTQQYLKWTQDTMTMVMEIFKDNT